MADNNLSISYFQTLKEVFWPLVGKNFNNNNDKKLKKKLQILSNKR